MVLALLHRSQTKYAGYIHMYSLMRHNSEHTAAGLGSHCRVARMCCWDMAEGMVHSVAGQDSLRHTAARSDSQTFSSKLLVTCIIIQMTGCENSIGEGSYAQTAIRLSNNMA